MKKTIMIMIMSILLIPLAFALHGGETWTYTFDECDKLRVNITAIDEIDIGEYTILNNCTNLSDNYYTCDCYNNYNFSVQFHPGAVNNYTFAFNYDYSRYVQDDDDNGNGGGGGRGGGVFTAKLELNQSITKLLMANMISRININGTQHTIKITEIGDGYVIVDIQDKLNLTLNKEQKIDFEDDNYYDLRVILKSISGKTARIEFKHIREFYEVIPDEAVLDKVVLDELTLPPEITLPEEEKSNLIWLILGITIIVLLLLAGGLWYFIYK